MRDTDEQIKTGMDVYCSVFREVGSVRGQIKTYKNKGLVPCGGTTNFLITS